MFLEGTSIYNRDVVKMAERPLGVTIICVLGFLGAILSILGGAVLLGLGGAAITAIGTEAAAIGGLAGILGGVILIVGIVSLIVLYWLWNMKKIGWTIYMILEIIGIVLNLVSLSIIGLIIPIIIVAYLWTKKDLFK